MISSILSSTSVVPNYSGDALLLTFMTIDSSVELVHRQLTVSNIWRSDHLVRQ